MSKRSDIVLVPGMWLGSWVWDGVIPFLDQIGHRPHPVTLPGLEEDQPRRRVSLDEQIAAVRHVVSTLEGPVVLVGHAFGATVINGVADLEPDRISRLVYIDDTPLAAGQSLPMKPDEGREWLELPEWDGLTEWGMSSKGIDAHTLEYIRSRAVPQPAGVLQATVTLSNPARKLIPVTMVCCSMSAGSVAEAFDTQETSAEELQGITPTLVDLPTCHWPMFSRPEDLAWAIDLAARA